MIFKFSLSITTDENIIEQVSTTNSNSTSQLDEDRKVIFKVSSSSSVNTDTQFKKESCSSFEIHKSNYKMEDLKPIFDLNQSYDKDYSPERDLEDLLSIVEPCQDVSKASSEVDSGAASDSADTPFAQINLMSLTKSELTANEDICTKVSWNSKINLFYILVWLIYSVKIWHYLLVDNNIFLKNH